MKTILLLTFTLLMLLFLNNQTTSQEIWGLTKYGGEYDKGVIFKLDENASNHEVVFSFETVRSPEGGMTEYEEGVFYGMTAAGGKYDFGVIYSFDAHTGGFTKILDFDGVSSGKDGAGEMKYAANGKFYGMTVNGGEHDFGIIFEFDPSTHQFIKILDFDGNGNGSEPLGNLIEGSDGKLYGMTSMGGEFDTGVIFSYDYNSGEFSKLFDFNGEELGSNPMGGLTKFSDSIFYGMTRWGGLNEQGVIFRFSIEANEYTVEHDFNGEETGRNPHGNLIKTSNGKLYGLTPFGGNYGLGVLFEYDVGSSVFVKKYDFISGFISGVYPYGSLVETDSGLLYGLSNPEYQFGDVLFEFNPANGSFNKIEEPAIYPRELWTHSSSLMLAANGNLYFGLTGTSNDIKNINYLYEYNPSDYQYVNHYTYSGIATGDFPHGSLLQTTFGWLYGTTNTGGKYDHGTVFKIDPVTYYFEKVVDFEQEHWGANPNAGLVQANNKKLYGMTSEGGAFDMGVLYEVDATTGEYNKLIDFDGTNGKNPEGPLVNGANGKLYGAATFGGAYNEGVLFEFDPGIGAFKKLLDFEGEDTGRQPFPNSLAPDSKGLICGTTFKGGIHDKGVLFAFNTESGIYKKVIDFEQNGTIEVPSNLALGDDNALYGYLQEGSSVFKFNPDDNAFSSTNVILDEGYLHVFSGKLLHATNGKLYGMDGGVIWHRATDFTGGIFEFDLEAETASLVLEFQEVSGSNPENTSLIQLKNLSAPVAQCKNISLFLDDDGPATLEASEIDDGSSGYGIELNLSKSDFTCEDIGEDNIVLTVTDEYGNSVSCNSIITIQDTISPIVLCRDIEVFLDATGIAEIEASVLDAGSSDACSIQSMTLDVTTLTCENIGENRVELTATDNNNNISTCSSFVTVTDTIAPVVICNDIEVSLDALGVATIEAVDIDNGSNDACGIESITLNTTFFTCGDLGENAVELTVTDNNGNSSTCTAMVTIIDNLAPDITCTSDFIQYLKPYEEVYSIEGTDWDTVAEDNCQIESIEYAINGNEDTMGISLSGVGLGAGVHEIGWLVADAGGNETFCLTIIAIEKRPTTLMILENEIDHGQKVIHVETLLMDDLLVQGVEGKSLVFAIDGASVTTVTNEIGVATVSIPFENVSAGKYSVTVWFDEDATYSGTQAESEIVTGISDIKAAAVKIYPNPFTEWLYFEFTAIESADARIDLFDSAGRLVSNIFKQPVTAGSFYKIEYRPHIESSSFLLYRMKIGNSVLNGKVIYEQ